MILVSNIQEFALPRAGYFYPSIYRHFSLPDKIVWHVDQLLFNEKSLILFGVLFGVGIILADRNRRAANAETGGIHFRRQLFLLGLGLAHSYLLWPGDILVTLALGGLAAHPLRRARPQVQAAAGFAFLMVGPLVMGLLNSLFHLWDLRELASFGGEMFRSPGLLEEIVAKLQGGFGSQMEYRIPASLEMGAFVIPYHLFWSVTGSMLIGMALFRSGYFSPRGWEPSWRTPLMGGMALVGLFLTWKGCPAGWMEDRDPWLALYVAVQYNGISGFLVLAGWVELARLIVFRFHWDWLSKGLARAGRNTLTLYIMQTLIGTWVFNGHGLGLFGRVDRAELFGMVPVIWALQWIFIVRWESVFRLGPLEWLQRVFVHRRWIPLLRSGPGRSS